ncbi:E3 ubiquitin-protein ligase HRD1 [Calliphora vicina]|uniref:E3 ubiquitin-protein ligase HRD1 n=1 Tax=Calliphora vicina TaxID=7373 RepID=UPI00325AEB36
MQLLLSTICLGLTSAVIGNAWYQKKQFYPAVVYITKSNASMAVIYIQFFAIVFMFGKLLRKIFLGTLRAAEFEHLLERFWYAITETCLAFTVFRDDFNPRFVALFTVLLFLKSFHWLAEERVDFMERSPVLGWLFHIRVASLLMVLGTLDYMLLMHAYNSTLARGPTVQLVFGFEYAILLTVVASTAIKYVLHAAEMRTDTPWENKAVFLLYTELFIGFIKVILYVLFVVIMAKFYALPMFVFRPMFFTIRNFKKALSDVIMSRRAIRNMNTLYPDATPEELRLSDNICIICREDMVNHSKKLPCGHIFHTICLRSWFQRQQTCPTCRLNILRAPATNSTALPRPDDNNENENGAAAAAAVNAGAGTAANAQLPNANAAGNDNPASPAATNVFEHFAGLPNPLPNLAGTGGNGLPNFAGLPMMAPPFMMPPPFPFIAPYAVPPPPMPPDLTNFTDEELKALEGNERKNIEERIKLLRNIQLMLDAANILMNNYQIVAARTQNLNPTPAAAARPAATAEAASSNTPASTVEQPSTSAAAAAATASATDTATPTAETAKTEELPTTSAAAALLKTSSPKAEVANTITTTSTTDTPVAKHNQVTIEDLGGEDHIYVENSTSTTTAPTTSSAPTSSIDSTAEHMNELRKRRLKFLEERNKTSTE